MSGVRAQRFDMAFRDREDKWDYAGDQRWSQDKCGVIWPPHWSALGHAQTVKPYISSVIREDCMWADHPPFG